jgi:uncharacterized protein YuzE
MLTISPFALPYDRFLTNPREGFPCVPKNSKERIESTPTGKYLMKKKKLEPIVNYDPSTDVLYLVTHKGVEAEFKEITPGVNVELDKDGQVIGVEILGASRVLKNVLDPLYRKKKAA